jgi:outer membrane immunogenic protein
MLGITVMKKLVTSLAAFTALTAAASAADLPRRAPPPVFTPVPVFTWTGAYFGINAGYAFDASSNSTRGFVQTPGNPVALVPGGLVPYQALLPNGSSLVYDNNSREGFSGGGQIGYNWQLSPGNGAVIGFEADAQYLDFGRRARFATNAGAINPGFIPVNGTLNTIDFFGTVRGRLGYAFDRTLVYATGGFAYATGTDDGARVGFQNFAGRRNDFKTGWTVGGGIEYALPTDSFLNFFRSSAVTLKVEGLYVNLDSNNRAQFPLVGAAISPVGLVPVYSLATARRDENAFAVVRAGLNYKFGSY